MTLTRRHLTRRSLLGAAALLPLVAATSEAAAPTSSATPENTRHDRLVELERQYEARLGVYAVHTGTCATVAHRADERFAFCSTFKGLAAAAVLHRNPMSHLDTLVKYTEADLMKSSRITRQHVDTGMTIRELCDAAIRFSDGTAGNLLLRDLGGPNRLTAYVRGLGDRVTRMDRIEPFITEATPGDPRDTSSPRALGTTYRKIVVGNALPSEKRAFIRDLMERNVTGGDRIRAGVEKGWVVADKTGTGDYGTLNDIGLVWPPNSAPLLISIMSSKATKDAEYKQALLADATRYAVETLT
ncbi:class A beta-lactamase [Streptoalloteichus hindustanus]|uniref:Beta-lactamase n=1 Tax=Streptoalloteichus hindustanus TaxID=2017 RepID=A0A1M5CII9_STRHI|nr:class A beta-lactamase [Streptoalloteichus hindustanus]SHF54585.1 beta-lactamase class A [Streptoalloteichus hindustanus]